MNNFKPLTTIDLLHLTNQKYHIPDNKTQAILIELYALNLISYIRTEDHQINNHMFQQLAFNIPDFCHFVNFNLANLHPQHNILGFLNSKPIYRLQPKYLAKPPQLFYKARQQSPTITHGFLRPARYITPYHFQVYINCNTLTSKSPHETNLIYELIIKSFLASVQ